MNEAVTPQSKVGSQHAQGFSVLVHIGGEDLSQKLIPRDFFKNLNGVVPDEFIFKTSSSSTGRCWFVKLQRVEEKYFLRQGWSQFVEYHSLEVGYSLVLKYKGNSQIYVKVFGKNGGEKEVLSSRNNIEKQRNPGKKKEQEEKSKEKLTNTKCRHIDLDYKKFLETICGRDLDGCSVDNQQNCGSSRRNEPSRQKMAVSRGRTGIPEAGCSYKTERPCFILASTQKNVYEREIPEQFLREVEDELPDVIFLKDQGAVWPVRLRKDDGRVWFQEGWEQFIENKPITNPQSLVFKFDGKFRFGVSILNTRDSSACQMEQSDAF